MKRRDIGSHMGLARLGDGPPSAATPPLHQKLQCALELMQVHAGHALGHDVCIDSLHFTHADSTLAGKAAVLTESCEPVKVHTLVNSTKYPKRCLNNAS